MTKKETNHPRIPEFEAAITRGRASYTQLLETICHQRPEFNEDEESRLLHGEYQEKILSLFEECYGGIKRSFEATNIVAGCVYTELGHFEYIYPHQGFAQPEALLNRLSLASDDINRYVGGQERLALADRAYAICSLLLTEIDGCLGNRCLGNKEAGVDSEDWHALIGPTEQLLLLLENRIREVALRNAQLNYCAGMLAGCMALLLIVLLLQSLPVPLLREAIGAMVGGALGAVASVMTRLSNGKLNLDFGAGPKLIILMGAFRPAIGCLMATGLWFLIGGKVLPIVVEATDLFLFYAGVGFLSGFSERWAGDMLQVGREKLTASVSGADVGEQPPERDK